jgi:hypothetical protein
MNLAGRDLEVDAVERLHAGKPLADARQPQHCVARGQFVVASGYCAVRLEYSSAAVACV